MRKLGVFLAVFLALGLFSGIGVELFLWRDRIYPKVAVAGLRVGGLTRPEAARLLASFREEYLSGEVVLRLGEKEWRVKRKDLGYHFDARTAAEQSFRVGRSGPWGERLRALFLAWTRGVGVPLETSLAREKARSFLQRLSAEYVLPPQEARLVVTESDEVRVIPGRPGRVLDVEAALRALEKLPFSSSPRLDLVLRPQPPQVQTEDVLALRIKGLLSSYTTYFDVRNTNRTYNIHVAADALDNCLVRPGEVFSFNRVVGPRSKEAGYKEALIIERDQFTPGLGGGVCQVSSTLYNAVLLAGLEVVERSNHTLPVGYVPLGRDATVAYGGRDLKFRNNTPGALLIKTKVRGGSLTVKIFGDTSVKKDVRLEVVVDEVLPPQTVVKEDPNLYVGKRVVEQQGAKGYRVRVYRVVRQDGRVTRELVSRDLYRPVPEIVRLGTMPVPEVPAPPPEQAGPPVPVPEEPQGAQDAA